ncbi:efflux RND transporter periplasmic adaptor subunit [Thioclava sp. BHET1]|nr:efflux RND transporter periplasmic adaptor subunit [Thioclava sp. BHET1]
MRIWPPNHRLAALLVLLAAAIWVVTGRFSSVGSDQVHAAQPAPQDTAASAEAGQGARMTVAAIAPVFTDHARRIRISGETRPDKSVALAARSSGIINRLEVAKGQHVTRDQVLLVLDGPELAAQQANAEALLAQRERELAADEGLARTGHMAELPLIAARSAVAAARAQVSEARAALDRLSLRAPFSGVIETVDVEAGQWVQAGATVARLVSLDPIIARAEVSETDIGQLRLGGAVSVTLADGAVARGRLRYISKLGQSVTRTYPVEAALANPDLAIPAGMTAELTLQAPAERAVVVPRSVLTLSEEGQIGLRMVDADDVVHFAKVRLIDDTPEGIVLGDVPTDMRIITAGQDLVTEGERVEVVAPPAQGKSLAPPGASAATAAKGAGTRP